MPSKDFKNQLWNSLSPELHIIYGPVCTVQYSVQCVYCTVYSVCTVQCTATLFTFDLILIRNQRIVHLLADD